MRNIEKDFINLYKKINSEIKTAQCKEDIEEIIKLCNKAYTLLKYFVNDNILKEYYVNLRTFEHYFYISANNDLAYLMACKNILERIVFDIENDQNYNLIKKQQYFPENNKLDLANYIQNILQSAKNKVIYYDKFADYIIIGLFQKIRAKDLTIISDQIEKVIFKTYIQLFEQQENKKINVRNTSNYSIHDRYIIIDNAIVWTIGGTLNSRPQKGMTINKIEDESEIKKIINDIDNND